MRTALAVAVLLYAIAACAQELDVFDVNDFVDPRNLGATLTPNGALACPCHRALVATMIGGGVHDYVDVLRPTSADVLFAHVAASYYAGLWQVNLKTTGFEKTTALSDRITGEVPNRKYSLQLGHYYTFGRRDPPVLRAQLNYSGIEYRRPDSAWDRELGAEVDISFRRFAGSLVYLDDQPPGHGHGGALPHHRKRLGFNHRLPRWTVGGVAIDVAVAAGVYQYPSQSTQPQSTPPIVISPPPVPLFGPMITTNLTKLTIFPTLEITSPSIPKLDVRVHARYAPSVQRIPGSWQTSNQIGLFIDRVVLAKTF